MLRQLPPTITADETPEWLPVGWIVHSTVLRRGRQTKSYTHLKTGRKLSTKDQVIEYIRMNEIRERKESAIQRKKELLKALEDEEAATRERASRISYFTNPLYKLYDKNMSSGLKQEVPQCQNTKESEAASSEKLEETGSDYITYDYNTEEEEWSENEYVEDKGSQENVESFSNNASVPLRLQPERMTKLESRAITQCLFEDEENIQEVENSKADNDLGVVSHLVESFGEGNLQNVVVVDKAMEIPGLPGSFTIEINLNCEPSLGDTLVEKDSIQSENIEIRDQESDFMHTSASPEVAEEPLETQPMHEETANVWREPVFYPFREAPVHVDDLINTVELGLNPCPDTPQGKNISGSKKRKKSEENIKKKLGKGKKTPPRKPQGGKGSSSSVEWPQPCPSFPFEPLRTSEDDDSVIRRYLEQHYTDAGSADGDNIPLPDFGLPSFSNIKLENESKEKKTPEPTCVASSSLPCY